MADNTVQTGADNIATDDIITMNGATVGAGTQKAQRVKVGWGDDSIFRDSSAAFPFPTLPPDAAVTGTMAAANAVVAIATAGRGVVAVELTGTWVGTVSFQGTSDPAGTAAAAANWYPVNAPAPTVTVPTSSTAVNGLFRVNSGGYTAVRVNMTAYTSGTATAWINASGVGSMVTLAEPITVGAAPDVVGSGTITATDAVVAAPAGTGAFVTGTPTAGSYVALLCPGGDSSWDIQLTGTFGGGTVWTEASFDSTNGVNGNWINVNGRQTGVVNTVLGYGFTTAGLYRGNTSGTTWIRARITGATTPSVAVVIRSADGVGAVFLNASIPAGSNEIGSVKELRAGTLVQTATGAAATATATLPAAGAGLFHYITSIRLERFMTAVGTVSATRNAATTTNLNGLAFTLPADAAAQGVQSVPADFQPVTPVRSAVANTATTVVTPLVAGTTYLITVVYFTAA